MAIDVLAYLADPFHSVFGRFQQCRSGRGTAAIAIAFARQIHRIEFALLNGMCCVCVEAFVVWFLCHSMLRELFAFDFETTNLLTEIENLDQL